MQTRDSNSGFPFLPPQTFFFSFPGAMLDSGQLPRPPPRSRRRSSDTLTTSISKASHSANRHSTPAAMTTTTATTTTTKLLAVCVFTAAALATVADAGERGRAKRGGLKRAIPRRMRNYPELPFAVPSKLGGSRCRGRRALRS